MLWKKNNLRRENKKDFTVGYSLTPTCRSTLSKAERVASKQSRSYQEAALKVSILTTEYHF
jgi:hypothetical protein